MELLEPQEGNFYTITPLFLVVNNISYPFKWVKVELRNGKLPHVAYRKCRNIIFRSIQNLGHRCTVHDVPSCKGVFIRGKTTPLNIGLTGIKLVEPDPYL